MASWMMEDWEMTEEEAEQMRELLDPRPEDLQAGALVLRTFLGQPSPYKLDDVGREFYLDTIGG